MKHYLDYKMEADGLFQTRFEDGYVVWKPLSWKEFRKFRDAHHLLGVKIATQIEEAVYHKAVVFSSYDAIPPDEYEGEQAQQWIEESRNEQPAGVIPTIVKSVLFMSGAQDGRQIMEQLNQHRPLIHNLEDQLIVEVCRAFPAYKPEELEDLSWQEFLKRVAQAEIILGYPFELTDDEEEQKKAEQKQRIDIAKEIRETTRMLDGDPQVIARQDAEDARAARLQKQREMGKLRNEFMRDRGQ